MELKHTVQLDEFPAYKDMIGRRRSELRALLDTKASPLANAMAGDLERFYANTDAAWTVLNQLEVTSNNGVRVRITGDQQAGLAELSETLSADAIRIADHARAILPAIVGHPTSGKNSDEHDIVNVVANPLTIISGAMEELALGLKSRGRAGPQ